MSNSSVEKEKTTKKYYPKYSPIDEEKFNSLILEKNDKIKILFPPIPQNNMNPEINPHIPSTATFTFNLLATKSGVRLWSAWTVAIYTILIFASSIIRFCNWSPDFKVPNSSVGIITSAISLILVLLSRDSEHPYVHRVLAHYRWIISLVAFNLLIIGILASIPLNKKIFEILSHEISLWDITWTFLYIFAIIILSYRLIIHYSYENTVRNG